MADFTKNSVADMAAANPGINMGTTGSMRDIDWGNDEDAYWRDNFSARPYVRADRGYDFYQPAYQYGFRSASHHKGREWADVEPELERGWAEHRGTGTSTWQDVKDAVRDAWDRVRGAGHHAAGRAR
jgi:hypothetical protein